TSNRNPGHGRDIFYFTLSDSLRPDPVSYLKGFVVDALTGKKLKANIVLSNLKTNKVVRSISQEENEGDFLVCLPSGNNYGLNITRKGYLFSSENLSLVDGYTKNRPREITIRLQPVVAGTFTTLKNIFFETNSWQLREESQTQLDEMVQFMKQNPGIVMELVGHTDRVGTESYNLELSKKRAETVASELVKRGIEPYRIKSRGAGFSVPVGDNATEEGRSANRRTEFWIKEVKNE
ncbi:MAG: OmpA family protein, partial [Bacteroidetes bacterium]|nr:OmpA family protein [Bacteroidota bacterium]